MKCEYCGRTIIHHQEIMKKLYDKFGIKCCSLECFNDFEATSTMSLTEHREYREQQKKHNREFARLWREFNKNDLNYKLQIAIRTRICKALRGKDKSDRTLNLLGCSIAEFKQYLEAHFQYGMSWDNYGISGWHVDHIKPCCSFDLRKAEEQRKCFHYTNLQPLWAKDNYNKGGKYDKKTND